jgi:hypothetical protein
MDQIEELERSLPDRLRATAEAMPLDPDALAAVRTRAGNARRRRRGAVTLAGAAAAVALVAGGLVVLDDRSGDDVTVADGSTDTVVTPAEPDAVLVTWRYAVPPPGVPSSEIDVIYSRLFTDGVMYHQPGTPEQLGADSVRSPAESLVVTFAALGDWRVLPPEQALDELLGLSVIPGASPSGNDPGARAYDALTAMLTSGLAGPEEAAEIRRLLEAIPGTTVTDQPDRSALIEHPSFAPPVVYEPATGHPLRTVSRGPLDTSIEFLSVERVVAADVLVPGRGSSNTGGASTTHAPTSTAGHPR